jgi:hypothetical protein
MSDNVYPDELIKKAKDRIFSQLDGNGVDLGNVKFDFKRGGVDNFSAETLFSFDCNVKTVNEKGRSRAGRVVAQGQLQTEIQNYIIDFQSGDDHADMAKAMIVKLPMNGFGADKQVLDIPSQKTILIEHQTCGSCQGQGRSKCQTCKGQARMPCPLCHAHGLLRCMTCSGVGTRADANGQQQVCNQCQGRRESYCTQCHGQKTVACAPCQSTGQVSCGTCGGEGAQSIIATIIPVLKTQSAINIPDIDSEDAKNMVAKVGAERLAKGGHITVKVLENPPVSDEPEPERAYFEKEPADTTKNRVFYDASVQWAVCGMVIGKVKQNIAIAGSKGAILDSGHFMDQILSKPKGLMSKAARGDGFVARLLKDACAYRVSRETLDLLTHGNRKSAMAGLQSKYALGTTQNTLKSFVIDGYQALKRITQRPRYIGLGVGLCLASAFYALWFLNGLRDNTAMHVDYIRYGLDVLPLVLGVGCTIFFIKIIGYFTLKSVMSDVGITNTKMPAVGKAGLYALIGNIAIWGALFANLFLDVEI